MAFQARQKLQSKVLLASRSMSPIRIRRIHPRIVLVTVHVGLLVLLAGSPTVIYASASTSRRLQTGVCSNSASVACSTNADCAQVGTCDETNSDIPKDICGNDEHCPPNGGKKSERGFCEGPYSSGECILPTPAPPTPAPPTTTPPPPTPAPGPGTCQHDLVTPCVLDTDCDHYTCSTSVGGFQGEAGTVCVSDEDCLPNKGSPSNRGKCGSSVGEDTTSGTCTESTYAPTKDPTIAPSGGPTTNQTASPTVTKSSSPSLTPTDAPTSKPSSSPTVTHSGMPSVMPSLSPTDAPISKPSSSPTEAESSSPSLSRTNIPTSKPSQFPTGTHSGTPSIAASSTPSASPTVEHSSSPSAFAQPTHKTPMVTLACPDPDSSPTDVGLPQGGVLEVGIVFSTGTLCTVTEIQSDPSTGDDIQIIPLGRSYNGLPWESATGSKAAAIFSNGGPDCTSTHCSIVLPAEGTDSRFVLTSYAHDLSQRNEVARFLNQVTFGVTTDDLNHHDGSNWTADPAAYRAQYVKDQMISTPMTSHREWWRKRTNPKITHSAQIGRTDHPCDPDSRWRVYTFNRHDRQNMINGVYKHVYFYTPAEDEGLPDPVIYEAEDVMTYVPPGEIPLVDLANNQGYGFYGVCEGDCDNDRDCQGDLTCWHRNAYEPVPGCYGWGTENTDYCIDGAALPAADAPLPLTDLQNNQGSNFYGLCEGDCDNDSDCEGDDLMCFQRDWNNNSNYFGAVPGCTGVGTNNTDYCYNVTSTFEGWIEPPYGGGGYKVPSSPNSGHTGTGYLDHSTHWKYGAANSWVMWTIVVETAGIYALSLRYSNERNWAGAQYVEITVNEGTPNAQTEQLLTEYSLGSNDWRYTPYMEANLVAGNNTVKIKNMQTYGANIDHLRVGRGKSTIINVDGHNRTVINDRVHFTEALDTIQYSTFNTKYTYEFCDWPIFRNIVWVEGRLRVRPVGASGCGNANQLTCMNPIVNFDGYENHVPGVVFNLPSLTDGVWANQVDEQDYYKIITGYDFRLLSGITDQNELCASIPSFAEEGDATVLAKLDDGTYLQWTPQLVLEENIPENPIPDGGGDVEQSTDNTKCSNAPRNFLNEDSCVLSNYTTACTADDPAPDVPILLDKANIMRFFDLTGRYVYSIMGLVMETHHGACQVDVGEKTRWMKNVTTCPNPTNLGSQTNATLVHMLSTASDTANPLLVDVKFPDGMGCDVVDDAELNIQIQIGEVCYTQVHPHLYNVYDATGWISKHPGGELQIRKWAEDRVNHDGWHLIFPSNHPTVPNHPMSRWDNKGAPPNWISVKRGSFARYLDIVSYRDLENGIKNGPLAEYYGAAPDFSMAGGTVVCGSHGEVANDPLFGSLFDSEHPTGDATDGMRQQKTKVWTMIALEGQDQLRQRMAWALSQIVTVVEENINARDLTEVYLNYYDIMVRHAFGNYFDILKEASYSPLMAEHLTYIASKSHAYVYEDDDGRVISPDENFAREVMQLFSIGLVALNEDGMPQRDQYGNIIETYTNEDVMSFARAWTGFQNHGPRGNYETDHTGSTSNRLDPMYIEGAWRDRFPKTDLSGGYIGDNYPLCVDLPEKMFLRKGARYRLLGSDPMPQLMVDHPKLRHGDTYNITRMVLDHGGPLHSTLYNGGKYAGVVELTESLACAATECEVDTVRVVQISANPDVFYEYVALPCVHQAFYEGGKQVARRYRDWDGVMCADPRLPAASEACCNQNNPGSVRNAFRANEYDGERMTYAKAEQRCNTASSPLNSVLDDTVGDGAKAEAYDRCQGDCDSDDDCKGNLLCFQRQAYEPVPGCSGTGTNGWDYCVDPTSEGKVCKYGKVEGEDWQLGYHWTSFDCATQAKINNEGYVAIVHYTDVIGNFIPPHLNADETLNYFKVYWNDSYPNPARGCGSCRLTETGDACICPTNVVDEMVFSAEPTSVEDIVSNLSIGALDPAISGSYTKYIKSAFSVHSKGGSETYDTETVFEVIHPYHGAKLFLKNVKSTVYLEGWDYEPTIFEAEDAVAGGDPAPYIMTSANTTRTDYSGIGYMEIEGTDNGSLTWTATVPETTDVTLAFRFESTWPPTRQLEVYLNGNIIDASLDFPSTGHWDYWMLTEPLNATLNAGDNTISLRYYGPWTGPKVDYLRIEGLPTTQPAYSFRNAPHFMALSQDYGDDGEGETNPRDAHYETDAVLDHYFRHTNTAPFICTRLIQRHGISNPSPRYVKECATAFRTGSFTSKGIEFGNRTYGDLEATAAAITLDPEASSAVLEIEPGFGSIQEPFLRVIHLLRSLEVNLAPGENLVGLWNAFDKISQEPHRFPTVFSFFLPEYTPDVGPAIKPGYVSPEAMTVNMPTTIDLLNGLFSLVKYGVSDCYDDSETAALGFGTYPGHGNCIDNGSMQRASASLDFVGLSGSTNSTEAIVDEIATLLTGGRLSPENRATIIDAYNNYTPAYDTIQAKKRLVTQLMLATPEFHTTTTIKESGKARPAPTVTSSGNNDYRATILLFFDGGADTHNMVPPHTCSDGVREKYEAIRGGLSTADPPGIALPKEKLHEIETNNEKHICSKVGLHQNLPLLKQLYDEGKASFFTNIGLMNEPITKSDYRTTPVQLFAHNAMQLESKKLDLKSEAPGTGVLGRMRDSLIKAGYSADAYSIAGNQISLIGEPGNPAPVVLSSSGMKKFNPQYTMDWWDDDLTPPITEYIETLNNATKIDSSFMAETWSMKVTEAIQQHDQLYSALENAPVNTIFPDTPLGKQLKMVTQMMQTNAVRGTDRDFFHVAIGGWDTHSWVISRLEENFDEVNAALDAFVKEVKYHGFWDDTVLVQFSEFARTLDPNTGPRGDGTGAGSDHAWGGNSFAIGGSLKGRQVLGQYPNIFTEDGPLALSRGRMLPTTPWDSVWNGVAPWMSVPAADMDIVLPMRSNFNSTSLFTEAMLFNPAAP